MVGADGVPRLDLEEIGREVRERGTGWAIGTMRPSSFAVFAEGTSKPSAIPVAYCPVHGPTR